MNIRHIRDLAAKLWEATEIAKEGKENLTEKDEKQISALEEFLDALESALDDLNLAYEG